MSPVFDPSKWSLPVSVVASTLGLAVAGALGVASIHYRLGDIEKTLSKHDAECLIVNRFAKWISKTEKANPPWQGADIDAIHE